MKKLLLSSLLISLAPTYAQDSTPDANQTPSHNEQPSKQKKQKKITRAKRPNNRPESANLYDENNASLDAELILGKMQQMVNGVFNIAKDPKNPTVIESSVANIFGGLAAIATHAAQRNTHKNQPVLLKNFFDNLSDEFKKLLLAYAKAHAQEFQQELTID